jgi:Na+/melibiose symporter-like transporter
VNFLALFPDKFRDSSERISASAFVVYIGFGGIVGSILIPPLLITYGDVGSYMFMAGVCIVISFICGIFMIPGLKDDKENVQRYLTKYEVEGGKKESFFKILKQTLKHKSFVIFLTMYILYLSLTHLMNGSIIYFVRYVLKGEASMIALISLALMIGGLISVPFWIKLNKKLGDNRKTMIIGGIIMVCFASLLSLFTDLTLVLLVTFLFGFGLGGYWVMVEPVFGQIIDESVVNTEQRREGAYNGIRVFFTRAAVVIQAITLALVHELTGFVEGAATQPTLAVLGIRLHIGLIPAIFMAIGLLVFWKFFDLTPEKAIKLKEDIIKLKL